MFFLDYSSLKNRPVYLVDSSSLTSSPLGRELPAYLLFSAVTSSREDSFAVNAGQGTDGSPQVIQGTAMFGTLVGFVICCCCFELLS